MFKRKPVTPEIGEREREGDGEKNDLRKRDGERERKYPGASSEYRATSLYTSRTTILFHFSSLLLTREFSVFLERTRYNAINDWPKRNQTSSMSIKHVVAQREIVRSMAILSWTLWYLSRENSNEQKATGTKVYTIN